ncbi:hypothetical protein PR003_g13748 [Phytophthora rubi]|uniref:Uncharacterized protein n=1 Tax=Phytophthora rubi TaxID=129364 RepID=A0A6A4FGD5_9STRA|nr:hypothetical protein PR002_g16687 [Phytophthora rubi]KAE9018216.1 hypothetical protein PR001_g14193 [Phytophthora rubi]KAE9333986.1 hypothetical protein PR003_g13748 [Phytophthora rubi]
MPRPSKDHPVVNKYLAANAAIVLDPDSKVMCVLVLDDEFEELTEDQRLICMPLRLLAPTANLRTLVAHKAKCFLCV